MSDPALWQGPPSPPDAEIVVNDPSCQGILGVTLRQALDELIDEPNKASSTGADGQDTDGSAVRLTSEMAARVMTSLGAAIAHEQTASALAIGGGNEAKATSVVLKGRLDHYNKRNGKWRLVIRDAKLLKRVPLKRNRRKLERMSLWDVCREGQQSNGGLKTFDVEILAYNDV